MDTLTTAAHAAQVTPTTAQGLAIIATLFLMTFWIAGTFIGGQK